MWTDTISAWQHSQDLSALPSVYLKAKAAEPRPHLLASLVAMKAHIIPLSPCKPRAASCAKSSTSLPLTKTSTRSRNSLWGDRFFHGNFAYLYSAEGKFPPLSHTHTPLPWVSAFHPLAEPNCHEYLKWDVPESLQKRHSLNCSHTVNSVLYKISYKIRTITLFYLTKPLVKHLPSNCDNCLSLQAPEIYVDWLNYILSFLSCIIKPL